MLVKKIDFTKYKKKIDSPFTKLMAESIKTGISKRTRGGNDYNGKSFDPYTKAYAKKKGVSKGNVNLHVSGNMLEAMKYKITKNKLRFFYTGDEGKKAHGNQVANERKFFGVDAKQIAVLKKKIVNIIVSQ